MVNGEPTENTSTFDFEENAGLPQDVEDEDCELGFPEEWMNRNPSIVVGKAMLECDRDLPEFDAMVWATVMALAQEIIDKNNAYNGAYWELRKACVEKYGEIGEGIPYFVHAFEKAKRMETEEDSEDAEWDGLGYHLLEYVIRKLEASVDLKQKEAPDLCWNCGSPLPPGKTAFCSPECRAEWRKKPNGKFCLVCGKPLVGQQEKYCCPKCRTIWRASPEGQEDNEVLYCEVCNKPFKNRNSTVKTCSVECAAELRGRTMADNAALRRLSTQWSEV